jgi:hypothetical protein
MAVGVPSDDLLVAWTRPAGVGAGGAGAKPFDSRAAESG